LDFLLGYRVLGVFSMAIDLFKRKQTHFVLWRLAHSDLPPGLYIGQRGGEFREIPLQRSPQFPDLWEVAAIDCQLGEGQVYHYWFRLRSSNPYSEGQRVDCTDPFAYTVDRHLMAESQQPASVILYRQGLLVACDGLGQTVQENRILEGVAANSQLVIYELPTRWTKHDGGVDSLGYGTFRDVRSLLDTHLNKLGINALELLPPADSDDKLTWGYGTANFFAADFDLGVAQANAQANGTSQACTDLADLITRCHQRGMRFFLDVVMAFARNNPYRHINFGDFFVQWKQPDDPGRDPEQGGRDGFGGDLFKFNYWVEGYHPMTGVSDRFVPAREYLKLHLIHWMNYYGVDGLRLDSVNNINNYDFTQEFKDLARQEWRDRGGNDERFLVVGEELSVPLALLHQNRLDSLWNERFKQILRQVVLGKSANGETFETSVRKLIDCRLLGFRDGAQAVNYLTSHDVGGYGNERLYNYLSNNGIVNTKERIKLAFVCLMTAVGLPMILAGEEFADQHDLDLHEHGDQKQTDPVNYSRMADPWRQEIFEHVARLTKLRTTSAALATNDVVFIHVDFEEGKRVLVWRRGYGENLVVVIANFSDYGTPFSPTGLTEYVIPHFPETPFQKRWHEVTQDRTIAPEWVGREPIFPWEAKVYELI
jgi:pullulanase